MQKKKTKLVTSVSPAKLAPNFDELPDEIVSVEETFWMGLTADCPLGQIDVAGLHFPKKEESIVINDAGKQVRVPEIGGLDKTVTIHNFQALMEVLPRLVMRMGKEVHEERGTGENTKHRARGVRGKLIKIPTKEMIAESVDGVGRQLKPYVRRPGDVPATDFMFFHHAPNGVRGHEFPTISEVGLTWPIKTKSEEVPVPEFVE
jgi:hypothetical protein